MNTFFVVNLPAFQENFKLSKSVAYYQSCDLKSQSQFYFDQSYVIMKQPPKYLYIISRFVQ